MGSLYRMIVLVGFTVGLMAAQTYSGNDIRQHMGPGAAAMLGMRDLRVAANLNLTPEQQDKIRAAFDEAAAFRKGMVERGSELRGQLAAAVKAGDEAQIDKISQDLGQFLQHQIAFQAKTVAKVYGTLTAEQRGKLEEEVKSSLGVMRGQRSRHRGQ